MTNHDGDMSRRALLHAGGAAFLVTATAGCSFFSTAPQKRGADGAGSGPKGKEAPMLAELVRQGKLPPVEERLPASPMVVQPNSRVGVYGGTWRTATLGAADWPWLGRTVGYEWLTRWDVEWTKPVPNLAEKWEYNEDATQLTFHLRRGLKWSDGKPFTSDDLVFAFNDVYNNTELYPEADAAGVPTAEKLGETSFRLTLDEPNALWAAYDLLQYQVVSKPFHYLRQFHEKYNPEVRSLAEREGYDSWVAMFEGKAGVVDSSLTWQNADMPTMNAWRMKQPLGEGKQVVLERNPYYWKTDPEGSQLPYLDEVVFDVILDEEVMLTRALNGDINMHMRHFNTLQNKPVLAKNRSRGKYTFFDGRPSEMNTCLIALNLTHRDPAKREIFRNRDFRIGLSHAIDRPQIIAVVYRDQGEPWQAAPRREAPFFDETLAKQYTEFDVDLANRHLDRAGYRRRNDDGVRLGPDGVPITFNIAVPSGFRPDINDTMELVVRQWRKVGIDARVKTEERSLFYERKENNRHDANVWAGDHGLLDALFDPRWYTPTNSGESTYAILWAKWYASDGAQGEEPPAPVKRQFRLYKELLATPGREKQYDLMRQILEISASEFMVMGVNLSPPTYGIVAENFHNVPAEIYDSSIYNNPSPSNPEQYFIEG